MKMHRCVVGPLAILVLAGVAGAGPLRDTVNSSVYNVSDTGSLYGMADRVVPTMAFGQVFKLDQDARVDSFSFFLNNSEGGTTHRNFRDSAPYLGYIMEWDPLDASSGSAKLTEVPGQASSPLFASQSVDFIAALRYAEYKVTVPGGVELKSNTEYVAFFTAFDLGTFQGFAKIGGAQTGMDIEGQGVVSNSQVSTQFADLHSRPGAFNTLDMDLAILIDGEYIDSNISDLDSGPLYGPEPASFMTWALLGCVGMAFGWRRWQRRRQSR
jgi:hypothetical protein